jgi:hypothetical protein
MDERGERIGRNEALFRQVNEQIEGLNESFGVLAGRMTLVCECGSQTCLDQIELTPAEYEQIRADPQLFAIKPEHDIPDVEDVVERGERYWIVRKASGEPARLAEQLDPRS